jgi:hypothetical protein
MTDAGIGRLLVASLHQAIADRLPSRLEFYEHWLHPSEGGDLRIRLAPLGAVLSFLRREGQPVYDEVMALAGSYSAEWTCRGLSALERRMVGGLPSPLRARFALYLSLRLVHGTFRGSKATVRVRQQTGTVTISRSVFCTLRHAADVPMCGFYAAGVERMLQLLGVAARVSVSGCRAEGAELCTLEVALGGSLAERPAEAA